MNIPSKINFVIPLFNEKAVFEQLIQRLINVMESSNLSINIILVDDGSTDDTPVLMKNLAQNDSRFTAVILSRNFGHQIALTAGLAQVSASEAVMVLDGDLQDPPELIDQFYDKLKEGYDVVYAIRQTRKEIWWKQWAYAGFYRLQSKLTNIAIPIDSGDFCIMSRRVVDHLNSMPEESRYIRGMRSWIGFKQTGIAYHRDARADGDTKYPISKLMKLAFNGVFNFSEAPIQFITFIGGLTILISGAYLGWILFEKIVYDTAPKGFTAIIFLITLFGGAQMMAIGLLGEYVLRIFFQSKGRPLYIVKEIINK
ncbi:MAG TPA: glycosyltransferase family 2 protein [Saprospiraceae bacterium]|nr:glycosyltransferase family 2 protein [Saprospiraceae bacterium]